MLKMDEGWHDDMMLHMVYSVYCLLSPCPASCSWKRGRGGCTGGRGRGRRSSAARAAPAAAATCCPYLLQGAGEVYWGNVKNIRCLFESCKFSQSRRRPLTRADSLFAALMLTQDEENVDEDGEDDSTRHHGQLGPGQLCPCQPGVVRVKWHDTFILNTMYNL